MINHVDDIDYTNGHILRDKNLLQLLFYLKKYDKFNPWE